MNQVWRERLAVALIAISMTVATVMAVLVARDYGQPAQLTASGGGGISGDLTTLPSLSPSQTAQAGGGTTTTTNSGGGGGGGGSNGGSGGSIRGGQLSTNQANSGVQSGTITVGGIFDMTQSPVDSRAELDTVKAYFNVVNQSGGVNGRTLQMLDCDSHYDETAMKRCVRTMQDAHVLAVVGWTAPKAEDDGVVWLTQAGIPVIGGLGTPNEYRSAISFPVSAPFVRYGTAVGHHGAVDLGFKYPAIVDIGDVPWLQPVQKALTDELARDGATVTDIESVSATQSDYSGTVYNLEHNGCQPLQGHDPKNSSICPDSLIAALDPFSYTRLFNSMHSAGWYPAGGNGQAADGKGLLAIGLDKGSTQNAYGDELPNDNSLVPFLSPYDHPDNPTVKAYESAVKSNYPDYFNALDIYTQHSWTSAMVFVHAIQQVPGDQLNRATLVQALNSIQNFDTGWSKPLSYGQGNHDPNHCFTWTKHDNQLSPPGIWHTTSDWNCFP